jgi:hypothetical protein
MSPPRQSTEANDPPHELPEAVLSGVVGKQNVIIEPTQQTSGDSKDVLDLNSDGQALRTASSTKVKMDESQETLVGVASPRMYAPGSYVGTEEKAVEPAQTQNTDETSPIHDGMESSIATLRPDDIPTSKPPSAQHLSADDQTYLDPTPKTPISSQPPSRSASSAASIPQYSRTSEDMERSPTRFDAEFYEKDEKASASEDEREANSRSEIQSIMDQFSEEGQGPGHEEVIAWQPYSTSA